MMTTASDRSWRRARVRIAALLAVLVAGAVVVGGCGGSSDTPAKDAQKESDAHSITQEQYDSIEKGDARDDLEDELGKPWRESENEVEIDDVKKPLTCLTYRKEGEQISAFQFCFLDGKVSSKKAY